MAAGRDMVARLILSLTDRATAGLRAIQQRLQGLAAAARRVSGIGALVGAISFAAAIRSAASFEGKLRDIAITAGHTGRAIVEAQRRMRLEDQRLAVANAERSEDLTSARGVLISRGMDEAQASQYMAFLARFTSASGAAAEDIANLTFALDRLSKITDPEGMQRAYAIAMRAGQMGGFEVRDMARHLGGQLARAQIHGLTGHQAVATLAAMNQMARDAAGSPDEGGRAVDQALVQMFGEDFQKRFIEKLGMDPRGVMQHARETGRDPIFALLQRLEQLTRGRRNVIGELIPDANAASAINAIILGFERFREIRNESGRATWALVDQVATDRQEGAAADMRRFNEEVEQLARNLGDLAGRLLPLATSALSAINVGLAGLNDILDGKLRTATGFVAASIRSLVDGFDDLQGRLDKLGRWLREQIEAPARRFEQGQEFRRQQELQGPLTPEQRRENLRLGRDPYRNDPIQPQSGSDQRSQWHGKIEIALAPGLVLRRGEADVPGISIGTDRGLMLRPV